MKPLVIYHANCTDGFGAAFAAWKKLSDEAEYMPQNYGEASPDMWAEKCRDRDVYILDFSFPKLVMDNIFHAAKRVVWLDHHKTAFEMWCGKAPNVFFTIHKESDERKRIVLDDCKSGALLAWEYFHPGTEVPMLIQHIDDRDRWQFKLEGSKELHAYLATLRPWSFNVWQAVLDSHRLGGYEEALTQGAAILRAQDQTVQQIVKHARMCVIPYDTAPTPRPVAIGLAVNSLVHQSEVGHELANKSGTFGLAWYLAEDNTVRCSFRSNGDYDVSAIAKAFGGGGHRNAAGCTVSVETLLGWLNERFLKRINGYS